MDYRSKYKGSEIEAKLDEIFKSHLQDKAVEITENGVTEVTADAGFTGLSKVVVNTNVQSGGGTTIVSPKDVNFRDYDGTILHSYTKDAFLALAEMPTLPTRQGLTCQGWNYNFEEAREYVAAYGVLEVGATYITDDGKTRLYITIAAEGRMNVPLQLQQSVSNGVVVDWGDGSATETFAQAGSRILRHTYGKVGDYVITLEVTSGTLILSGATSYGIFADSMKVYGSMLQKVEIGNGVTIGDGAFRYCYSLSSVIIPNGVTSIGSNTFGYYLSLASVVIPNGVTSIGSSAFRECASLASVVIPNGVTSIDRYTFYYCYSLASIVIPNSVTSIGDNAFVNCYSLASIVIPNSVTSIGEKVFVNCSGVAYFDFRTHTSVPTLSNYNAFSSIASDCKIVVPDELYDSWIAATNWSNTNVAKYIVKASEFNG